MSIIDTLYVGSILIGLFFVHFVMPLLLMWLLKVVTSWAFYDIGTISIKPKFDLKPIRPYRWTRPTRTTE